MDFVERSGRRKIFTDETEITRENVIKVLQKALPTHEANRSEIKYLLDFDKGVQPLIREKTIRPEIDIKSIANIANEITEFKLGYVWGNPVAMVQKSDAHPKGSDKTSDNDAIASLNEMYYAEEKDSKDSELGRYVEICGVGYQMIDIKRDRQDDDSPFDLVTLNPMYTFVVYSSDVYHRPMLGVTYIQLENYQRVYTCVSKDAVYIINEQYEIVNGEPVPDKKPSYFHRERSGESNPIGDVYIIEFNRSADRTGCFERQIDEMNALNVLESDFVNDVAQNTQAIWWGNDIELEKDESTGEPKGIQGGQWVITKTFGDGHKPDIKALTLQYDYTGVLANITSKHDAILERAYVPNQSDPGGGSTASAMSMSSGWSAAEQSACKESLILKRSFQRRNRLAIKATNYSVVDSPLKDLSANDIEVKFLRQKTFNLSEKVNSLATMIQNHINPKDALETVDLFSNLSEVIEDSVPQIEEYQKSLISKNSASSNSDSSGADVSKRDPNPDIKRNQSDLSDQTDNSPILGNKTE